MDNFSYQTYLARWVVGITTGLALGYKLKATTKVGLSDGADETFALAMRSHAALHAGWKRQQTEVSEDKRPLYQSVCAIWTACVGRVENYKALDPSRHKLQPVAVRIHKLLAPDGAEALKLDYPGVWTTLTTRLELVSEAKLDDEFRAIAGVEFIPEVRRALEELGRALGLSAALEPTRDDNLRHLLRDFMERVSDYAFQVMATVRRDRPATLQVARAVLKPLDELRAAMSHRGVSVAEEPEATDATEEPTEPAAKPVETPVVVSRPSLPAPSRPSLPAPPH
jgi:hypothetical protein